MWCWARWLAVLHCLAISGYAVHAALDTDDDSVSTFDIRMPGVRPTQQDDYLCHSQKLPDGRLYIVNFEALAKASRAHHLLVYGCGQPLHDSPGSWDCSGICRDGPPKILFAWAKNAPPTHMPPDVGFVVGGATELPYIVLQIHYVNPIPASEADDESGVRLTLTTKKQKYIAGIFIYMSMFLTIPPHKPVVHGDVSCVYDGPTTLYPFAYRVHAHKLGRVISAYHNNGSWSLIGKGNPQWPQAFYPIDDYHAIKPGEQMAARCTFNSMERTTDTHIGGKHTDEMCNFYMMYYTTADRGLSYIQCNNNQLPSVMDSLPAGSDTELPPNPALEATATGTLHPGSQTVVKTPPQPKRDPSLMTGYQTRPRGSVYYHAPAYPRGRTPQQAAYNNPGGRSYYDYYDPDTVPPRQSEYDYYANSPVSNQRSRNQYSQWRSNSRQNNNWQSNNRQNNNQQNNNQQAVRERPGYYGSNTGESLARFNEDPGQDSRAALAPDSSEEMLELSRGRQREVAEPEQESDIMLPHSGKKIPASHEREGGGGGSTISTGTTGGGGVASTVAPQPEVVPRTTTVTAAPTSPSRTVTAAAEWMTEANSGLTLGQVAGVATDSHDQVWAFHRGATVWGGESFDVYNVYTERRDDQAIKEKTVLVFSPQGRLVRQWGDNMFYMPHGLTLDADDNVWLTDVALHQVMKFTKGEYETPALVLGERFTPGSDDSHFCKPTDVAVTSSLDAIFVADGYCNSRVLKYSTDGRLLAQWGTAAAAGAGVSPPPLSFDVPHSITVVEKSKEVCVADRENGRIVCTDMDGAFTRQVSLPDFNGRLFAINYSPAIDALFAVNGPDAYHGSNSHPVQGFVFESGSDLLLDTFGTFSNPHDVAASLDGSSVYVVEIGPNKIRKFNINTDILRDTAHTSVKKSGVGARSSVGAGASPDHIQLYAKVSKNFGVSFVIGLLLIIPIVVIAIVTVVLRLRKKGKLKLPNFKRHNNRRFNLGDFFGSHKGFDRLSTEDGDELDPLNSDSDVEEYSATTRKA